MFHKKEREKTDCQVEDGKWVEAYFRKVGKQRE